MKPIPKHAPHPPGGNNFEAVQVAPEGWLCLAPWIQSPDGYWWRPHIDGYERHGEVAQRWAEHLAREINQAMRRRTDPLNAQKATDS